MQHSRRSQGPRELVPHAQLRNHLGGPLPCPTLLPSGERHLREPLLQRRDAGGRERSPLQEDAPRQLEEGEDAGEDERGDEERADGIRNGPPVVLHKVGRDDETDAAQSVREDVQEDTTHVLIGTALRVVVMVIVVEVVMAVARTTENAVTVTVTVGVTPAMGVGL